METRRYNGYAYVMTYLLLLRVVLHITTGLSVFNWGILLFLGGILVGIVLMGVFMITELLRGENTFAESVEGLRTIIMVGLIILVAIIFTIRSLRTPPIHFNVNTKIMEIGRGASLRQIDFSRISQIGVILTEVRIEIDNEEEIRVGTVSGKKTEERAKRIAELIAEATGVSNVVGPTVV